MSTGIMQQFYSSSAWRKTREAYRTAQCGLCENCGVLCNPGTEVHHITPITPYDVMHQDRPDCRDKLYGWDNLCLLCHDCHNRIHGRGPALEDPLPSLAWTPAGDLQL